MQRDLSGIAIRLPWQRRAGALYCFATFPNGEIQAWVDYGRTALSSRCGIDAVLPDVIDDASLRSLHHHRFTVAYRLDEAAMTVRAAGE